MSNQAIMQWCEQRKAVLIPLALMFFAFPIWNSLGDHSFNGRSGARYAVVAQDMVLTGDWMVPHYLGRIHLTKPPLVYWLESASIRVLGHSYFSVRFPSAIAGTLSLLLIFWFSRKRVGTRAALMATGLYAIMPMTIGPARMTVTDSVVNLCWLTILFSGFLSIHESDRRRWRVVFWIAASVGMLAKGPVLFIPIGLVGVWQLISRYDRGKRSSVVWFFGGVLIATIPALIWAYGVYLSEPSALSIWRHETLDRATGSGDHSRPIWFFIPVLLAGCFPVSAMMILPGINLRFKQAWSNLRDGSLVGFLGWAIIVPFVVYSLISGKLPSYLLPICGPFALLSAIMLERWFKEPNPNPGEGRRLPEVRFGLMLGTLLYVLGIGAVVWYGYGPSMILWTSALVPAVAIAVALVIKWNDHAFRVVGMSAFIGAWVIGWVVLEELEDQAISQMSYLPIVQQTFGHSGWGGPIGVYQIEDAGIYWDRNGELDSYSTPEELRHALSNDPDQPILLFTSAAQWDQIRQTDPQLFATGVIKNQWVQWPGAPERYLVVCDPQSIQN